MGQENPLATRVLMVVPEALIPLGRTVVSPESRWMPLPRESSEEIRRPCFSLAMAAMRTGCRRWGWKLKENAEPCLFGLNYVVCDCLFSWKMPRNLSKGKIRILWLYISLLQVWDGLLVLGWRGLSLDGNWIVFFP